MMLALIVCTISPLSHQTYRSARRCQTTSPSTVDFQAGEVPILPGYTPTRNKQTGPAGGILEFRWTHTSLDGMIETPSGVGKATVT